MDGEIGIAMLGAGFIAEYHLAGIAAAAGAGAGARGKVRLIAARSHERAAPLAAKYGIPGIASDWREALDRSDIDAVVICTPDHTHEEMAIAAADAGKAILLQKPMAGTVAACERIIAAADRARVDLQVSFMHRYFPEVDAARQLLADGAIGRVHSLSIRNATSGPDWGDWFFSKSNVTGGVIDQLGVHGIDLAMQLAGDIREVSAQAATLLPTRKLRDGRVVAVETPDTAYATYRFADGAMAAHEMSMIEMKGCDRFRLELYGDQGTMWLRSERGPLAVHAPGRFGDTWHCPALPEAPFGALHHRTWLEGVTGKAARLTTARDALRGMQVVEAIRESSAANGTAVAVEGALQ
jgi:predicted dehydrogenase